MAAISNFGQEAKLIPKSHGIWQLTRKNLEDMLDVVKIPQAKKILIAIEQVFGIDMRRMRIEDLKVPVASGLTIYILFQVRFRNLFCSPPHPPPTA